MEACLLGDRESKDSMYNTKPSDKCVIIDDGKFKRIASLICSLFFVRAYIATCRETVIIHSYNNCTRADDESVDGRGTWFPNYSYGFPAGETQNSQSHLSSDQINFEGFEVFEEEEEAFETTPSYMDDEEDNTTHTDDTNSLEKNMELFHGAEFELKDIVPESGYHLVELEAEETALDNNGTRALTSLSKFYNDSILSVIDMIHPSI